MEIIKLGVKVDTFFHGANVPYPPSQETMRSTFGPGGVKFDEVRVRWRQLRGWHQFPSPNFWLELDPQWSTRLPGFVPHIPGIIGFRSFKKSNVDHRHACTWIRRKPGGWRPKKKIWNMFMYVYHIIYMYHNSPWCIRNVEQGPCRIFSDEDSAGRAAAGVPLPGRAAPPVAGPSVQVTVPVGVRVGASISSGELGGEQEKCHGKMRIAGKWCCLHNMFAYVCYIGCLLIWSLHVFIVSVEVSNGIE